MIVCHNELVIECPEDEAYEEIARFVEEVVSPGLDAKHPTEVR
jgi:hypothetical protein